MSRMCTSQQLSQGEYTASIGRHLRDMPVLATTSHAETFSLLFTILLFLHPALLLIRWQSCYWHDLEQDRIPFLMRYEPLPRTFVKS